MEFPHLQVSESASSRKRSQRFVLALLVYLSLSSSFGYWEFDSEIISGMGTKLECAFNLLPPSPKSKSFSVHCVDELDYLQTKALNISFQITGLDKHHISVKDRMSEKNNIDFIRKTMQMHEDTFKQQVHFLKILLQF